MSEPTVEWGVRALHPCPIHGVKCPHSDTTVTACSSKEMALWYMDDANAPTSMQMVNPVLVRRTVTEWEEDRG